MSDSAEQILSLRFNVPNAVTAVRIVLAVVIAMLLIQTDWQVKLPYGWTQQSTTSSRS